MNSPAIPAGPQQPGISPPAQAGSQLPSLPQGPQGMPPSGGAPPMGDPMAPPTPDDLDMDQGNELPETTLPTETGNADLNKLIEMTNIAETLDEKKLIKIGMDVVDGFNTDLESRQDWEDMYEGWMKLALQVKKDKVFPWPKAANVKYPILGTAAMQFNARAYTQLVPADGQIVRMRVVGLDPDGQKAQRADRVAKHMSYQLTEEMPYWEEDMDKLLLALPITGLCYKKTYYDSEKEVNCSKFLPATDLVVNYWADNLENCHRKTEKIYLTKRQVKERQLQGLYCECDLPDPSVDTLMDKDKVHGNYPTDDDEATPYLILEQHTFLELDGDDYPEPYIVVVEHQSKTVLRIVARFEKEGIKLNAKGKIVRIEPTEYYTKFGFIPNPDGSFYDIGFGLLLGSLNETVDTIVNQLIDAGTLSNMQSGFIAKGLRMKMGETRFQPGEWKAVNATGDDLKKSVFPMPVRDPSNTLFELFKLLVQSAKELASVAEIMTGKMPGQNTPASTTQSTVEQSMQLFTSVYKRIYRSLTQELRKLYRLNKLYMPTEKEISVLSEPILRNDYMGPADDICPAADPSSTSKQDKSAKAQNLLQLMQLGTLDAMAVTQRVLDAQEQPNPQQLLNQKPPAPDPKMQIAQMKAQQDQQKNQDKMQLEMFKAKMDAATDQQKLEMEQQYQTMTLQFKERESMLDNAIKSKEAEQAMALQHQQGMLDLHQTVVKGAMDQQVHNQKLSHNAQAHEQGMQLKKEQADAANKQARVSGVAGK